jgi:WD40 repeat protein
MNGEIVLWDLTGNKYMGTLKGHSGSINNLVFTPDGSLLASTGMSENTIILWDMSTFKPSEKLVNNYISWVSDLAFSPDGSYLAISGDPNSRTYALWNVTTHSLVMKTNGLEGGSNNIAFSPDGKILAVGNGIDVLMLDSGTLQQIGEPLPGNGAVTITGLVFSPDGNTLAVASQASDIILWDVATHQVIGQLFSEHNDWAEKLVFSPDGQYLATTIISSSSLILWEMDPQSWIDTACGIVGRNFTRNEWMQYFSDLPYPVSQSDATCPQWPIEAESTPVP